MPRLVPTVCDLSFFSTVHIPKCYADNLDMRCIIVVDGYLVMFDWILTCSLLQQELLCAEEMQR